MIEKYQTRSDQYISRLSYLEGSELFKSQLIFYKINTFHIDVPCNSKICDFFSITLAFILSTYIPKLPMEICILEIEAKITIC